MPPACLKIYFNLLDGPRRVKSFYFLFFFNSTPDTCPSLTAGRRRENLGRLRREPSASILSEGSGEKVAPREGRGRREGKKERETYRQVIRRTRGAGLDLQNE